MRKVCLVLVAASCLPVTSCNDPSRGEIETLVAERATRQLVESHLGPRFGKVVWYEPGDANLASFLAGERQDSYKQLRDAVRERKRVLYSTMAWQMTWLFFDENDRLVGYMFAAP
jgi:hypothetical protein